MAAMKTVTCIAALLAATLTGCMGEPYDPIKCDYEQAQWTEPAVRPMERAEWVDYNDDGVVVLCMWTG
jgi:hypothetical protein